MSGTLFDSIIFGPLKSRRLGTSLGINLLPSTIKLCSFNCIYCECGWTEAKLDEKEHLNKAAEIDASLEKRLIYLNENHVIIDSITFAGNGEPTLHPEFSEIIDITIRLRDKYTPDARISVLSNSTTLSKDKVREALMKVDNIMKLDAGSEEVFRLINNPKSSITLEKIVEDLKKFKGNLIIQTMFVRGEIGNRPIDNTEVKEVDKWLKFIESIAPKEVMIYSLDRIPPMAKLEKISELELQVIAKKVRHLNIKASVY
jgi:wyosine [tRNA(Phe)-imidazoG37] synthetase (radical SAM superfamily)